MDLNSQAYDLLRGSVSRFNAWKAEWKSLHGDEPVELEGAALSGTRLAGADLSHAILKEADLSGADLSGANLDGAVLYRSKAGGACLARCRLADAYLSDAFLEGADLSQVRAANTNFAHARLKGARFDHARLIDACFDDADLSGASFVGSLLVRISLSDDVLATSDFREAVIEKGPRTPTIPSVDFRWISDDASMFAIGQWTPRPEQTDDEVPQFVRNLRRFNRKDPEVMKVFAKLITGLVKSHHRLSACECITVVPSSKVDTVDYPTGILAQEVAKVAGIRDGSGWLIRHKNVLPSMLLSFASESKHLDSVKVAHPDLVSGRTVLLLDDFLDSGCSFRACRHLLLAAGAKKVFCLGLARRLPRED